MAKWFAIYIAMSSDAQRNLRIGLRSLEWGWKDSALDRADARAVARSIRLGDAVILGMGGPNVRTGAGTWETASLTRAIFLRVTQELHVKSDRRWPDDIYPNRLEFEIESDTRGLPSQGVDANAMEALRMSANKRGVPILIKAALQKPVRI